MDVNDWKLLIEAVGASSVLFGVVFGLISYKKQSDDNKDSYFLRMIQDISSENNPPCQKNAIFRLKSLYNYRRLDLKLTLHRFKFWKSLYFYPYREDVIKLFSTILKKDYILKNDKKLKMWKCDISQAVFNMLIDFYRENKDDLQKHLNGLDFRYSHIEGTFPVIAYEQPPQQRNNEIMTFKNVIICESSIIDCDFKRTNFENVNFDKSYIHNTRFHNSHFSAVKFYDCVTSGEFNQAILKNLYTNMNTKFCHCSFFQTQFICNVGSDPMPEDIFKGITFVKCDFKEAVFKNIIFERCNFIYCRFFDIKAKPLFSDSLLLNCEFSKTVNEEYQEDDWGKSCKNCYYTRIDSLSEPEQQSLKLDKQYIPKQFKDQKKKFYERFKIYLEQECFQNPDLHSRYHANCNTCHNANSLKVSLSRCNTVLNGIVRQVKTAVTDKSPAQAVTQLAPKKNDLMDYPRLDRTDSS